MYCAVMSTKAELAYVADVGDESAAKAPFGSLKKAEQDRYARIAAAVESEAVKPTPRTYDPVTGQKLGEG